MNTVTELANEIRGELKAKFRVDFPQVLNQYPIQEYINAFVSTARYNSYRFIPPSANNTCKEILKVGNEALAGYHRLILAHLISNSENSIAKLDAPTSIKVLLDEFFSGILRKIQKGPDAYFHHEVDMFAKDFAISRLKLLPCGAEIVDICSGIPKRLALTNATHMINFTRLWVTSGGLKTWYEGHWDRRLMSMFNEKGYNDCYTRIGELLECNPHIRGFISSSWWLDPALESISPELSFLRKIPEMNGAIVLKVGTDNDATIDATRYSDVRGKLFEKGKYIPQVYLLAWPRKDLLRWVKYANK